MEEQFKDIKGLEGRYQVSNYGRIKSLNFKRSGKECILKIGKCTNGYPYFTARINGILKGYLVHRLVYETFLGPIPEGMEVNHINEDKTDNRLENLNLLSRTENVKWGTGVSRSAFTRRRTDKRRKQVLQYDMEGHLVGVYPSVMEAQRTTGFGEGNIASCCRGIYKQAYGFIWKYK